MAACEPAFKVFGQIAGGAITSVWFALQTFCANGFQIAIERWRERAQFRRGLLPGLLNHRKRVLAQEWWLDGEKIKQDRGETVNVRRRRAFRRRSVCLFGSDIAGRARNLHRVRKMAR